MPSASAEYERRLMEPMIRAVHSNETPLLAELIRDSFKGVAAKFNLTPENCPTHPSNCAPDWIVSDLDKGVTYFILEVGDGCVGCAAIERADDEVCYLERLAVLPRWRGKGYGKTLVNHIENEAASLGAKRLEIALISEDVELKNWYAQLGFQETGTRQFDHLPFLVTFMRKEPI